VSSEATLWNRICKAFSEWEGRNSIVVPIQDIEQEIGPDAFDTLMEMLVERHPQLSEVDHDYTDTLQFYP
jgi:hypothetical protein